MTAPHRPTAPPSPAVITPQPPPRAVITKDFCTYTTKILRDHVPAKITARSAAAAARMEA
jgi:hypothetical protein